MNIIILKLFATWENLASVCLESLGKAKIVESDVYIHLFACEGHLL